MLRMPRLVSLVTILVCLGAPLLAKIDALGFRPLHADYSRTLERIIFTSADPSQLHVYNPLTAADQTVALTSPPTAVGVSLDGRFAAVGHDSLLTYVDLTEPRIVRTFPVDGIVTEVSLTGNLIFYSAWASVTGETSHVMAISDGRQLGGAGSGIRITPAGDAVIGRYGAYGSVQLARWPILPEGLGDPAIAVVSSFGCEGVLDIADDGGRIYSACGRVLREWPAGSTDPALLTHLFLAGRQLHAIEDRSTSKYVVALSNSSDSGPAFLDVLERQYLTLIGRIPLNPFPAAPQARWVFAGAAAAQYFVVTQSPEPTPETGAFRIETLNLDDETVCGAAVTAPVVAISADASRNTAAVTAPLGCLFPVRSDASWLSVTSAPWGQGDGQISWIARTNATGAARTGTISVGDQKITVTQGMTPSGSAIIPLPTAVLDSAFSTPLGRLIVIGDPLAELQIVDPATGATQIVPLPSRPTGLALDSTGLTAIVAHSGWVSYVNLATATLTRTVTTMAIGPVAAGNEVTYQISGPPNATLVTIRNLDAAITRRPINSSTVGFFSLSGATSARLSPSGDSLYLFASASSAGELLLYPEAAAVGDLAGGSYPGFWLISDPARLITGDGKALLIPANPTSGFSSIVSITAPSEPISAAGHSPENHALAVTLTGLDRRLRLYGDNGYPVLLDMPMPEVPSGSGAAPSMGKAIYWASNPTRVVTLVSPYPGNYDVDLPFGFFTIRFPSSAGDCNVTMPAGPVAIPAAGGAGSFSFDAASGCAWKAASSASWLTLSGGAVGQGGRTLTFTVTPNPTHAARSATVTVGGQSVTVTQAASTVVFTPNLLDLMIGGTTGATVTVSTASPSTPWTAVADAPWMTFVGASSGTGPGSFTVRVGRDDARQGRAGRITASDAVLEVRQTPSHEAPVNLRTTTAGLTPVLSWDALPTGPGDYLVAVSATRAGLPQSPYARTCTECVQRLVSNRNARIVPAGVLQPDTTYYWQVAAGPGDQGVWSAVAEFRTPAGPVMPMVVFRRPNGEMAANLRGSATLSLSGGVLAGDPGVARNPITEEQWVAARDAFGGLWLNSLSRTGAWGAWRGLGGVMQGTPAVAVTRDGTVHLAIRDQYNSYWATTYTAASGAGAWRHLGGVFASDPAIAAATDGSLRIVGRDSWGGIWSMPRSAAGTFGTWSFGGGITTGAPSVTIGYDRRTYIAVRDTARTVWVVEILADGTWGSWRSTGGESESNPLMLESMGPTLGVALVDPTGAAWYQQITEQGWGWQPWRSLGGIVTSLTGTLAGGELSLAGFDSLGNLWWQQGNGWTTAVAPGTGNGPVTGAR